MLPGETNAKVVGEIPSCFVFVSFFLLSYARQPGDEKKDGYWDNMCKLTLPEPHNEIIQD